MIPKNAMVSGTFFRWSVGVVSESPSGTTKKVEKYRDGMGMIIREGKVLYERAA
jgi:hypothetical protein